MRHEAIALAIFVLSSLAVFTGLMRRPYAGHVLGIVVAVAAAAYLVVALPPSLSPWARPHYRHAQALQSAAPTANAPVTTASPAASDGILVVALQDSFDVTKSVLSQLLQAATADKTRVVSDETVLQIMVGVALTALFAIFGFLIAVVRRFVVPA